MKKRKRNKLIALSIFLAAALVVFMWISGTYNSFVMKRNSVSTQWSQVETQYQRRFDLIPNLVEATKGYLVHEQKIFANIAEARTHYAKANGDEKIKAQGELETALARLLVIIENYPNLKADQTVRTLMDELAGTENRVNVERRRYNEEVRAYNINIQVFPNNLLANLFSFEEKILFVSETDANKAPRVNLEIK